MNYYVKKITRNDGEIRYVLMIPVIDRWIEHPNSTPKRTFLEVVLMVRRWEMAKTKTSKAVFGRIDNA